MPNLAELWRYQGGGSESEDVVNGASVATDGSVFLTGSSSGQLNVTTSAGENDFSAVKLDSDGKFVWAWQEGSEEDDYMEAAAAVIDGGVVVVGDFSGTWQGVTAEGEFDFAAVKLNSAGTVEWRWQTGTVEDDRLRACVATTDGNVVVAGYSQGSVDGTASTGNYDIVAVKLNVSSGEEIWTYQAGKSDTGGNYAYAAAARDDGSVVLAGVTYGAFSTPLSTPEGSTDFAAIAIDENGTELWRWQDGPYSGYSRFSACTALGDGSVILGGLTAGNWSGTNQGGYDFAVVKLNASGHEEWRLQDGTALADAWTGAGTTTDGSIVMVGHTTGDWAGTRVIRLDEVSDFAAMAMDDEGLRLWLYQDGTYGKDMLNAIAVGPGGSIVFAGSTGGTWTTSSTSNTDDTLDYAIVSMDGIELITPSPEAINPSTGTPSAPSLPPTVPTAVPQSPPAPALVVTPGPLSVTPSPTNVTPTPSSRLMPIEPANSSSSSSSSAYYIIGGTVAGVIALVILGVLAYRRARGRSNAATKTSDRMEPRQLPFAARAGGPTPAPPSYPMVMAFRP